MMMMMMIDDGKEWEVLGLGADDTIDLTHT
jgi:hypothetical protein